MVKFHSYVRHYQRVLTSTPKMAQTFRAWSCCQGLDAAELLSHAVEVAPETPREWDTMKLE